MKHALKEREVKTAAPPAGATETTLYDGGGLTLRVRRAPSGQVLKTWQLWTQRGGKRSRLGLGSWPAVSLTEARSRADRAKHSAASTTETVQALCEEWLKTYAAHRLKDGGTGSESLLKLHLFPACGNTRLARFSKRELAAAIAPLTAAGKHRTAGALFQLTRQIFQWAVRTDLIQTDPTSGMRRSDLVPVRALPRSRVLTPDELKLVAAAFRERERVGPAGRERLVPLLGLAPQAALWTLLGTAVRAGELTGATWAEIDLKRRLWVIPAERTKPGREHVVHLSKFACAALLRLKQLSRDSRWVLPGMGDHPITANVLSKQFGDRQHDVKKRGKRTRSSALLLPGGKWTTHDLRRTAATLMREEGVSHDVVELCLNHALPMLTRTYQTSSLMDERRRAFDKLGARLRAIVGDLS